MPAEREQGGTVAVLVPAEEADEGCRGKTAEPAKTEEERSREAAREALHDLELIAGVER